MADVEPKVESTPVAAPVVKPTVVAAPVASAAEAVKPGGAFPLPFQLGARVSHPDRDGVGVVAAVGLNGRAYVSWPMERTEEWAVMDDLHQLETPA